MLLLMCYCSEAYRFRGEMFVTHHQRRSHAPSGATCLLKLQTLIVQYATGSPFGAQCGLRFICYKHFVPKGTDFLTKSRGSKDI